MTNSNQHGATPPDPQPDKSQKRQEQEAVGPDEESALEHPPVQQVNPDRKGLNPDHLGPAQPSKPGE